MIHQVLCPVTLKILFSEKSLMNNQKMFQSCLSVHLHKYVDTQQTENESVAFRAQVSYISSEICLCVQITILKNSPYQLVT